MDELPRYTSKIGFHEEVQQLAAVNRTHGLTQTLGIRKQYQCGCTQCESVHKCTYCSLAYLISWTESLLHGMQPMSHRIDGIYDKAHLSVLGILVAQRLSPCGEQRPSHEEKPNHCNQYILNRK